MWSARVVVALAVVGYVCAEDGEEEERSGKKWREGEDNDQEKEAFCEYDNCYEILGMPSSSTTKEIKRKYRKLAVEFHPDRQVAKGVDQEEANRVFSKIGLAYGVLSDPAKRKIYDHYLANPAQYPWLKRFYKHKATAKIDIGPAIILLITLYSAFEYFNNSSVFNSACKSMLKQPQTKRAAKDKAEKAKLLKGKTKAEQEAILVGIIAEELEAPSYKDVLWDRIFLMPFSLLSYFKLNVLKQEPSDDEKVQSKTEAKTK